MKKDTWFTSDPHYGHKKVIEYCARPYADIVEMERSMIENHNAVVKPFDKVYYLGDVFFCGMVHAKEILAKLNGYKILIRGNHDRDAKKMLELGFNEVHDSLEIEIGKHRVNLSHFPYKPYTGDIDEKVLARIQQLKAEARKTGKDSTSQLDAALSEPPYDGLITNEQKERLISYDMRFWSRRFEDKGQWLLCGHVHEKWAQKKRMINVGVDVRGFKPMSIEEVEAIINGT